MAEGLWKRLKELLLRVVLVISGRLSVETSVAAYLFAKSVLRLKRSSGILFTALFFLKQCGVCLQQQYGGVPQKHDLLPVMVSLTRSGLPRIIPPFHRRIILRKDGWADRWGRWYLKRPGSRAEKRKSRAQVDYSHRDDHVTNWIWTSTSGS